MHGFQGQVVYFQGFQGFQGPADTLSSDISNKILRGAYGGLSKIHMKRDGLVKCFIQVFSYEDLSL